MNTFIHQGHFKLISKDHSGTRFLFQIKAFELSIHQTTFLKQMLSSTTFFNIDKNKKCFLSSESSY